MRLLTNNPRKLVGLEGYGLSVAEWLPLEIPASRHGALSEDEEGQARSPAARCVSATILFDGVCNLCNGFVQFVIVRDPEARFRFAALQSDAAAALLRDAGVRGRCPTRSCSSRTAACTCRSDAALRDRARG